MPDPIDAAPLLQMQGITKRFGSLEANSGIDLSVSVGEIHGLLGENGAGKTTLMRILSGFTEPDAGEIRMDGRAVRIRGPQQAMALGIGMVHQQWRLVERFTVYENLLLGHKDKRDTRELRREIDELGERFRLSVRLNAYVWQLSLGERQRVEILRVLQRGARLLILDEPTAVLSPQETEQLFSILRDMVSEGRSVVFISHKLREVLEHCHRITVLRHGKVVAARDGRSVGGEELAQLMVGRTLHSERAEKPPVRETTVLELDGIDAVGGDYRSALRGVTFRVRSGEILGVAGVSGNGQKELADLCSGLARPVAGSIRLAGNELSRMSPAEVNAVGVGFVPEDRLGTGVCPNLAVAENLILRRPGARPFARWAVIDRAAVTRWAEERVREFDIRLQDVWAPIGRLSGGNMQKAVVARELSARPAMLIAAQPTRGLDVAAMEAVHRILLEMRNDGGAILLISEDLDEILKLSDRLIVLHDGRIAGEFGPDAGREQIGLAMTGGWTPAAAAGAGQGGGAG